MRPRVTSRAAFVLILLLVFTLLSLSLVGCGGREPEGRADDEDAVSLPAPRMEGGMALSEAIGKRRSVRSFTGRRLTREQISQLLWAAQGVTDTGRGFRAAPSAGALYPLEVYVLERGYLYHYIPSSHSIAEVGTKIDADDLASAAMGQGFIAEAPAVFIIAAAFERTRAKYGFRGDRYVDMEAGHAAENLLLQAVALGLGGVPVGAFDDRAVSDVLGLSSGLTPLYIIPVGEPAGG